MGIGRPAQNNKGYVMQMFVLGATLCVGCVLLHSLLLSCWPVTNG